MSKAALLTSDELAKYKKLYADALKNWTDCMEAISKMCLSCSANIKQFENDCTDDCPLREFRTL